MIISESGIRFIDSLATILLISLRSSVVNLGTFVFCHFVKIKFGTVFVGHACCPLSSNLSRQLD